MIHFSPLLISKTKRSGRSFGRITVRHRGSGFQFRLLKLFNLSIFSSPYLLSRFFSFSKHNYSISNIFCFSKSLNKLTFFSFNVYNDYSVFASFSSNFKQRFPFFPIFSSAFFPFFLNHETFKEDDDFDLLGFSPYRTNFLNITNGAYINEISCFSITNSPKKILYSRAFSSYTRFIRKLGSLSYIKLPSSSIVSINTLSIFNFYNYGDRLRLSRKFYKNSFKAGFYRNLGFRPVVRGVAMNPIDHPHGGRTGESRPSVSPWAIFTKGYPTVRSKKKISFNFV